MSRHFKQAAGLFMFFIMLAAFSFCTFAADKISSVSITVSEVKQEAGTVWTAEPTVSNSYYEIEDYSFSSSYDDWNPGSKVTLTVTLTTTGERSFASKSDLSYTVSNGEKVSLSRKSSSEVTVKINYYPKVTLAAPTGICYSSDFEIEWEYVTYAGGYEVKLYRDGSSYKTIEVEGRKNTTCDFSVYATDDDYEYTFAIRAVAPDGKTSYIKASEWVNFDEEAYSSDENSVYGSFTGSGSKLRFKDEDGDYVKGWQLINGSWYYFDPSTTYAATGWLQTEYAWYYFDDEGRMLTGWQKVGDFWYYMSQNPESRDYGAMLTGWIQTAPTGPWYYLNTGSIGGYPYGAMLHDTYTPDGYWVDSNGEWNG